MIDWIPLELYSPFYFYFLLVIVFIVFMDSQGQRVPSGNKFQLLGLIIGILITIYIGFRPLSGRYFGDTGTYGQIFAKYADGADVTAQRDLLFHYFAKFTSYFLNVHFFLFACATLYVLPLYIVCKKWFKDLWFFGFIFLITAFEFWAYGTNGVRNGIAGSMFLLAISREKRIFQLLFLIVSINFHKTMLLPTAGFVLANFYNKPKHLIYFWLLCIPVSLIGGSFFENIFGSLGFDDRLSYFTEGNKFDDPFSSTGFRWDFLLYSASAVFAGWYYIIKKGYQDKIYFWLFNTFIFANAFWILVIRANFSNRFAYLSWFLMGMVIVYPLLRQNILKNQYKKVGIILGLQFAFTFLMNVILG